uniref:DNA topoisomerase (ATP-hydrolyzing) n=1 Tax=Aegilops tauschii subsp. strangulata TaxID=200361 RepID=A0A453MFZ0_AEGTS
WCRYSQFDYKIITSILLGSLVHASLIALSTLVVRPSAMVTLTELMKFQDHNASHIKGLLINFIHSEWPFLFKVPSFLVDFITPIIKATNNQSIAVKSFYLLPDYEAWKEQLGGNDISYMKP